MAEFINRSQATKRRLPSIASPSLTPETKQLVASGIGYRTEIAYGEGYRSAKSIIEHENDELGNDTISTVAIHLGLPADAPRKEVFDIIDRKFGKNAKAIWLAPLKTVKEYYLGNHDDLSHIDVYTLPRRYSIIEDLGYDGALFIMSDDDFKRMQIHSYGEWKIHDAKIQPHFSIRSKKKMGYYIALNWMNTELAKKFHIKPGEIIVREDWWKDPEKRKRLQVHELVEINLRERDGLPYPEAHEIATKFEHKADPRIVGRK